MPDHADAARTGEVLVPGATIYYKVRGHGPVVLLLQGGDGDADSSDNLAAQLADHFTILSYDRRGLSRSRIDDPSAPIDLTVHGDDAARVIAAVTDEPVAVFGTSFGALLGLDLLSRHPERIRLLIAHEPPATELLNEPDRRDAEKGQEDVEVMFRNEGAVAAMQKFAALVGLRFDDREPDVALPEPKPERMTNLGFFLTHDAPAVRAYRFDLPALRQWADRVIPSAGRTTATFPRGCAEALAAELHRPLIEFPGGHNGSLLHPREFGNQLLQLLLEHTSDAGCSY
ncbi:MAG: alpha/beta hydrolase [Acidipropionibacterium sp.]|jgi:pimeloyl-ACP methyl ester carboxylesterase|nr:alpha/beta hydrolase [Acidipropionibacterium sp.]